MFFPPVWQLGIGDIVVIGDYAAFTELENKMKYNRKRFAHQK